MFKNEAAQGGMLRPAPARGARRAMRTLLWSASLARATDTCVQNRPELLARASLYYCPNDAFLALAQREFPCATTFLDVGANKGYTAVEMLAYWAPGSVTPQGAASCGRDDFREISAGNTMKHRYRHAW